jgi:hypothetical protein
MPVFRRKIQGYFFQRISVVWYRTIPSRMERRTTIWPSRASFPTTNSPANTDIVQANSAITKSRKKMDEFVVSHSFVTLIKSTEARQAPQ